MSKKSEQPSAVTVRTFEATLLLLDRKKKKTTIRNKTRATK